MFFLVASNQIGYFEDPDVLSPYPDWYAGQYHFEASVSELMEFQNSNPEVKWYRTRMNKDTSNRPIFISLYEKDLSVVIDGHERLKLALEADPQARVPVVFIFNGIKKDLNLP